MSPGSSTNNGPEEEWRQIIVLDRRERWVAKTRNEIGVTFKKAPPSQHDTSRVRMNYHSQLEALIDFVPPYALYSEIIAELGFRVYGTC